MIIVLNQIDLFGLIKTDLQAIGGGILVSIARDPWEVQELLAEAPGRFRVIMCWDGEDTIDDHRTGLVAHKFRFIVSQNRGLPVIKGLNLSVGRAGDPALMTLANTVRDRLRTISFPDNKTSILLQYQGSDLVKVETGGMSLNLDAYELRFRFPAAINRVELGDFRVAGTTGTTFDNPTVTFDA